MLHSTPTHRHQVPPGAVQLPANAQNRVPTRVLARLQAWPAEAPPIPLTFSCNTRFVTAYMEILPPGIWQLSVQLTAAAGSGEVPTVLTELFTVNHGVPFGDNCGCGVSVPQCSCGDHVPCGCSWPGWPTPGVYPQPPARPWRRDFFLSEGIIRGERWYWEFGYTANDIVSARIDMTDLQSPGVTYSFGTSTNSITVDAQRQIVAVELTPANTAMIDPTRRVKYKFIVTGTQGDNLPYYDGFIDIMPKA